MIKKILFALALLTSPAYADSLGAVTPGTIATRSDLVGCTYNSSTVSVANRQQVAAQCDTSGALLVNVQTFAPITDINVNIDKVAGGAVATGHGTAAGALRVELPTDGTGAVGLNAGSAIIGKVGIDQTTPGTTNLVTAVGPAATGVALSGAPVRIGASDGTNVQNLTVNAAAILSATTQPKALAVAEPGEWTILGAPAINTVATATKAAGASGVRHVLRSLAFSLKSVTTAAVGAQQFAVIRDGASGSGSSIWVIDLTNANLAIGGDTVVLSGLNLIGSATTAMTIEFTAAGGANTIESVSASGYDTQ